MNDGIHFTVPGRPVAQARARAFHLPGGRIGHYDPKQCREYKRQIALAARTEMNGRPLLNRPLCLHVVFAFPGRKREADVYRTGRPDLDNLVKSVMDALNGVVWRDDALVCSIQASKVKRVTPWTEISVSTLE